MIARLEVCVVNPGRVRAFAHAEGLLAKTDRLYATHIKRFGENVQPRLHAPMDQAAIELREFLEHRRQLTYQLVAVRNRLELAGKILRPLLDEQVRFLELKFREIEKLISTHIESDDDMRGKAARLRQLKGVRPVRSATLLAYVPEQGKIADETLSALVGVAP